jgi:hypothetical protein
MEEILRDEGLRWKEESRTARVSEFVFDLAAAWQAPNLQPIPIVVCTEIAVWQAAECFPNYFAVFSGFCPLHQCILPPTETFKPATR